MSEIKHTPGPFHVSGKGRNLHIGSMHSPMTLASLNSVHIDTPSNALLFSASWDLLEALKRAERELTLNHYGEEYEPEEGENLFVVRAAIAKAEGQS